MSDNIRVLLADDHELIRDGLKSLINGQSGMTVVGEAVDGPSTLALVSEVSPDVAVIDISMPGMSGIEVTETIHRNYPATRVVVLTAYEDYGHVRRLVSAGAVGYILKRSAAMELVRAIRNVVTGGIYLDPGIASTVVEQLVTEPLTPSPTVELSDRETEVVRFIARGYSNKEIAAKVGLSVKTVETYKYRSLEKLGLHNRVDIVRYAVHRGWLSDI